ncbi:MAG TPA: hypothetical protein VFX02_00620 [Gammaproteobacteria bacterium]|nr:hypothetical protein [Gammaproteobacteria bacterium]
MKAAISKEQSVELRKWLEKQRLPKEIIDALLSSTNSSNTYKAYRQKKQITADGWAIHFGANWARQIQKDEIIKTEDEANISDNDPVDEPAVEVEAEAETESKASANPEEIKVTDTVVSRTFMGLAEKLKKLKIEDVDKPQMQKIAFEIDKDHLAMLKKYAAVKGQGATVGSLIRQAIREFLESI